MKLLKIMYVQWDCKKLNFTGAPGGWERKIPQKGWEGKIPQRGWEGKIVREGGRGKRLKVKNFKSEENEGKENHIQAYESKTTEKQRQKKKRNLPITNEQ